MRRVTTTRRRRARCSAAAVAAAAWVLASVAGCADGGVTAAPVPPSVSALPATPGAGTASADPRGRATLAAVAAYRSMWAAYVEAAKTADPAHPLLAAYATGAALSTLTRGLRSLRDRGLVARGGITLAPTVTGLTPPDRPATVEITDCADDREALLYQRGSDKPHNDKPGGRRRVVATVKHMGGGAWKVVSFGARDIGTC